MFLGTVREQSHGKSVSPLEYDCYAEMARRELDRLEAEARQRWPLVECCVVHRLGRLEAGQPSVAIAVSAVHRQPAFAAGQWLIDRLKEAVPLWKKETYADGSEQWI